MQIILYQLIMTRKSTLHKVWHIVKPGLIFVLTLGISAIAKKAGPAKDQVQETANSVKNEIVKEIDDSFDEHDAKKYGE